MLLVPLTFAAPVSTPRTEVGEAIWDRYAHNEIQEDPQIVPPLPPPPPEGGWCSVPIEGDDILYGYRGGCVDGLPDGDGELWVGSSDHQWFVYYLAEFSAGHLQGAALRILVRHPPAFTGATFFQGRFEADVPVSGTLFTPQGIRYWGQVSPTFGVTGEGEMRLPNRDTARGTWDDSVLLKGRYTFAETGDWDELRSVRRKDGTVKMRTVKSYTAPPLGTEGDCVPNADVWITTPGDPHWISGTVDSVGNDGCWVKTMAHGGSTGLYDYSRLVTRYSAAQKAADQERADQIRAAYESVMNEPAPAEDLFQSYLDAQDAYYLKALEEGTAVWVPGPCDTAAGTVTVPSYCH